MGFIKIPLIKELSFKTFKNLAEWYFGKLYSFCNYNLRKLKKKVPDGVINEFHVIRRYFSQVLVFIQGAKSIISSILIYSLESYADSFCASRMFSTA